MWQRQIKAQLSGGFYRKIASSTDINLQGELAVKNVELATATRDAEKLLKDISENTAIAETEKRKVAVIVDQVSMTAAVSTLRIHY